MEIFTPQLIALTVLVTVLATAGCACIAALLVNGLAKAGRYFGPGRRPRPALRWLRPRWTAPAVYAIEWRTFLRFVALHSSFLVFALNL